MRKLLVWFLPLVVALVSAGCGAAEPYAARVNGEEIGQRDLDAELEAIAGNADYVAGIEQQGTRIRGSGAGTFDSQFVARVLTRQVLLQLVHEELAERGALPSASEVAEARTGAAQSVGGPEIMGRFPRTYQETLARRLAEVTKLQATLSTNPVDDEAVRRYYEENRSQFAETCVSHILVAVAGPDGRIDQEATEAEAAQLRAQAEAIRAEILAGGDFAAAAAAHSKDPSNKDRGGSLGCLSQSDVENFAPPFVEAMNALSVGEISEPVQTEFGYHLIRVTERRVESLEDATAGIRQTLLEPGQQGFSVFIRDAINRARIEVNPRYGRFDKEAQSPGVVPPEAPSPPDGAGVPGPGLDQGPAGARPPGAGAPAQR